MCVYDSVTSDKLNTRPSHSGKYLGWGEKGDTRIVCAAVAKSEMIFRVDQKRGNERKQKKKEGVEQPLLSLSPLPALLPPVQWAWAQVGEGRQNLTKTKAARSNRLLPRGCHGNKR